MFTRNNLISALQIILPLSLVAANITLAGYFAERRRLGFIDTYIYNPPMDDYYNQIGSTVRTARNDYNADKFDSSYALSEDAYTAITSMMPSVGQSLLGALAGLIAASTAFYNSNKILLSLSIVTTFALSIISYMDVTNLKSLPGLLLNVFYNSTYAYQCSKTSKPSCDAVNPSLIAVNGTMSPLASSAEGNQQWYNSKFPWQMFVTGFIAAGLLILATYGMRKLKEKCVKPESKLSDLSQATVPTAPLVDPTDETALLKKGQNNYGGTGDVEMAPKSSLPFHNDGENARVAKHFNFENVT